MHQAGLGDSQPGPAQHVNLEGDVRQMFHFFVLGTGLHLNQVPPRLSLGQNLYFHQHIVHGKGGLKQGIRARLDRLVGQRGHVFGVRAVGNETAVGELFSGQQVYLLPMRSRRWQPHGAVASSGWWVSSQSCLAHWVKAR